MYSIIYNTIHLIMIHVSRLIVGLAIGRETGEIVSVSYENVERLKFKTNFYLRQLSNRDVTLISDRICTGTLTQSKCDTFIVVHLF